MITKKYYKLIRVSHADEEYLRITNISNEAGTFSITRGTGAYTQNIEYSLDGVTWNSYDVTNPINVTVIQNANIYFRGNNPNGLGNGGNATYLTFNFDKDFIIGGNIMSICDTTLTSMPNYCIYRLFENNTHLISISNVNFGIVTSLGNRVLAECFKGCTSLTDTFYLSDITSVGAYCFLDTFNGCSSLTTGLDLRQVTTAGSHCLEHTFYDCIKLSTVTAPNISDLTQNNILYAWLDRAGTSATGTKVVNVPTGATITTNSPSGIPSGWTRVDY